MSLSPEQHATLEQLWAITASSTSASRERDERLLRENGWDVQVTVEQIFSLTDTDAPHGTSVRPTGSSGSSSGPSRSPGAPGSRINTHLNDTDHGEGDGLLADRPSGSGSGPMSPRPPPGSRRLSGTTRRHGVGTTGAGLGAGAAGGLWGILTWPLSLLWGVVGGAWYLFIRTFLPLSFLPHLPSFLRPPSSTSPPRRPPPLDPTAATLSFIRDVELQTSQSVHGGSLPEFYIGPYREFLSTLKREGKVGMVVLVCNEHEDDAQFKREVLADPELVRCVKEREMLVWGADIRTREGYQVAGTLLATTYPSLYFVSLLPGSNGSSPKLSIINTLSGPPSTTTSTSAILQLITTSILPRTSAFLARLKRERLTLEEARHLREEQDRAFREAERKDREKLRLAREKEEVERIRKDREAKAVEEKARAVEQRKVWRRYARKHLLPPSEGPIRVALRTPLNAERNVRNFTTGPSTESLFIYAETLLIPKDQSPESDPDEPPRGFTPPEDFTIVTAYPRKVVERIHTGGEEVWEMVKKAGGAVFAEKVEGSAWAEAELRELRGEDSDDEEVVEE
ncbi:hypothetical protein JCM24511_05033 [Saitozyma sp. JCM 24511]|nr:hypothetical protein JCM24511_05033 [Saitozyma sp. JCM 24511]